MIGQKDMVIKSGNFKYVRYEVSFVDLSLWDVYHYPELK